MSWQERGSRRMTGALELRRIGLALGAFVIVVYVASIVRMGPAIVERSF